MCGWECDTFFAHRVLSREAYPETDALKLLERFPSQFSLTISQLSFSYRFRRCVYQERSRANVTEFHRVTKSESAVSGFINIFDDMVWGCLRVEALNSMIKLVNQNYFPEYSVINFNLKRYLTFIRQFSVFTKFSLLKIVLLLTHLTYLLNLIIISTTDAKRAEIYRFSDPFALYTKTKSKRIVI